MSMPPVSIMRDSLGNPVRVGDRICIVSRRNAGRVLTVRALKFHPCGWKTWGCRADDAKDAVASSAGDFEFAAWLRPSDITLVDATQNRAVAS